MKTIIIIPTYNEKDNIELLINRIMEVIDNSPQYQVEILVVDDSSPDGTGKIVKKLIKKNPQLHLLCRHQKEGLGAAYVAGMSYALNRLQAEVVFEMDGDFSHDPNLIPVFLNEIAKGADLVVGSRYIPGGSTPVDWGLKRRLISWFGNFGIRLILRHLDNHEWSNGYRAIRRWLVEKLKDEMVVFTGYTFQVAFLHQALHAGANVVEIPIHFTNRRSGRSKFPTRSYITDTVTYVFQSRLKELIGSVFFKFCLVGLIGFVINAVGLEVLVKLSLVPSIATALAAELAIISNFIWNSLWTFNQVKLARPQLPGKFLQFNLASSGAVVIQYLVLKTGELYLGLDQFKTRVLTNWPVAWYHLFFMVAVCIGLVWNFYFYSHVVWRSNES